SFRFSRAGSVPAGSEFGGVPFGLFNLELLIHRSQFGTQAANFTVCGVDVDDRTSVKAVVLEHEHGFRFGDDYVRSRLLMSCSLPDVSGDLVDPIRSILLITRCRG